MRNSKTHRQYGAVPFAIDKGGRVRIVLLTSRQTGRWVIPKGWPMAERKPTQVAVREAYRRSRLDRSGLAWQSRRSLPLSEAAFHRQVCDMRSCGVPAAGAEGTQRLARTRPARESMVFAGDGSQARSGA